MKSILLLHRGAPSSPEPQDVSRFIKEFYTDMRVAVKSGVSGWLDKRKHLSGAKLEKIAHAYKHSWHESGSSTLNYQITKLTKALKEKMPSTRIDYASCFGTNHIEELFKEYQEQGIEEVQVIPLYPQSSLLSTQICLDRVRDVVKRTKFSQRVMFLPNFYREDGFIESYGARVESDLKKSSAEHLLFCFASIGQTHLEVVRPEKSVCGLRDDCCNEFNQLNRFCYRAQCFDTSRRMAAELGLAAEDYSVLFYPVLELEDGIAPQMGSQLDSLTYLGVKRLAAVCMSACVDTVESKYTLKVQLHEYFMARGGEDVRLLSCLNSDPDWVSYLSRIILFNERWIELGLTKSKKSKRKPEAEA